MDKEDNRNYLLAIILIIMIIPIVILGIFFTPHNEAYELKTAEIDSLKVKVTKYKELANEYKFLADSLSFENCIKESRLDTLQTIVDSINAKNFEYQYKIGRIKNYIDIVNKNSTQSKYLKGWITRVLNE